MNGNELINYTRVLTGLARNDVVSDQTLIQWIQEAHTELARERSWRWLEATDRGDLPAWVEINSTDSGEFFHGYHQIQLPLALVEVLAAYLVTPGGEIKQMTEVPEYDHIYQNDPEVHYKVYNLSYIRIVPEQESGCTYRIRYTYEPANLNVVTTVNNVTGYYASPTFDDQFHQILAYRVAAKVLQFISDDTPRAELYMREYDTLLMGMIKYYELSNDYNTFSLGQDGVDSRRYVPWFRPA